MPLRSGAAPLVAWTMAAAAVSGCGRDDERTREFHRAVEAKLCRFEPTARSITLDVQDFLAREGNSATFDREAERSLLALIGRFESYYRKVARTMRTIKPPQNRARAWSELTAVYTAIHADARHARYKHNTGKLNPTAGFLTRYDRNSERARRLRRELDLPARCRD